MQSSIDHQLCFVCSIEQYDPKQFEIREKLAALLCTDQNGFNETCESCALFDLMDFRFRSVFFPFQVIIQFSDCLQIFVVVACTIAFAYGIPVGVDEPRPVVPMEDLAPMPKMDAAPMERGSNTGKDMAASSSYGYGYYYRPSYYGYGSYPYYGHSYGYPYYSYHNYGYYPYSRTYHGRYYWWSVNAELNNLLSTIYWMQPNQIDKKTHFFISFFLCNKLNLILMIKWNWPLNFLCLEIDKLREVDFQQNLLNN